LIQMSACVRCGHQPAPGAQYCPSCGLLLAPIGQAVPPAVSPAYSPAAPPPPPYPPFAPGYPAAPQVANRPLGIAVLVCLEIGVALVGLLVVRDLLYWMDWRFTYDEAGWALVDAALAALYGVASIAGFMIASRLWYLQARAWKPANLLSIALVGAILFGGFTWGFSRLDLMGLTVHAGMLGYLNMTHVRRLFGRPPLAL
jgi:hypothetical protein